MPEVLVSGLGGIKLLETARFEHFEKLGYFSNF